MYDEALEFISQLLVGVKANQMMKTEMLILLELIITLVFVGQEFSTTIKLCLLLNNRWRFIKTYHSIKNEIAKSQKVFVWQFIPQVKLRQFDDEIIYFKQSLAIRQNISSNVKEDRGFAYVRDNNGIIRLRNQKQFNDAVKLQYLDVLHGRLLGNHVFIPY